MFGMFLMKPASIFMRTGPSLVRSAAPNRFSARAKRSRLSSSRDGRRSMSSVDNLHGVADLHERIGDINHVTHAILNAHPELAPNLTHIDTALVLIRVLPGIHDLSVRPRSQPLFRSATTPPATLTMSAGAAPKLSFHVPAAAHTKSLTLSYCNKSGSTNTRS